MKPIFFAAAASATLALALPAPIAGTSAMAAATAASQTITIGTGGSRLIKVEDKVANLLVASPEIADVQVNSPTSFTIVGKAAGETTVFATSRWGSVLWSANVRVGANLDRLDAMLRLAMPESDLKATPMNGMVLLTGTVLAPADIEHAQSLVQALAGKEVTIVNRIKTATPQQVSLHVKIAEVSRDLVKQVGINLMSRDTTGGFLFGISQGRNFGTITDMSTASLPKLDASSIFGLPGGSLSLPFNPATGQFVLQPGTLFDLKTLGVSGKTVISAAGKLAGLDIASAIDLAENDGLVTTLAEPNLTAVSGETASFLAGGEVPIPVSEGLGNVTIQYRQYGVSLAFSPVALSDGRISLKVRPEVSQLTSAGSVQLNGFTVPGLSTRRAETTVELGSGQSFMIGGLMSNNHNNVIDKAPGLGDLPILGALFRSKSFRRSETELVIVVTPYLVKPTSADRIALPTDGYKAATDAERLLLGQSFSGKSGAERPKPQLNPEPTK